MELFNDEIVGDSEKALRVLCSGDVSLRQRAESVVVGAEVNLESSVDDLDELSLYRGLVICSLLELFASGLDVCLLLGNDDLATLPVLVHNQNGDRIAD